MKTREKLLIAVTVLAIVLAGVSFAYADGGVLQGAFNKGRIADIEGLEVDFSMAECEENFCTILSQMAENQEVLATGLIAMQEKLEDVEEGVKKTHEQMDGYYADMGSVLEDVEDQLDNQWDLLLSIVDELDSIESMVQNIHEFYE